jgi:hypothetical protein
MASSDDKSSRGAAQATAAETALIAVIAEKRASDPLIGAKVAAKQILSAVMNAITDEKGIHAETLLTILGSLAGFSCQMGIREECALTGVKDLPFVVLTMNDGKFLFMGDRLNAPLLESQYSVWSLCGGVAQHLGASLPDIREIARHVVTVAGTPEFGRPRIPTGNQPGDLPVNYVRALWQPMVLTLRKFCGGPHEWHIAFGLAAQEAITLAKGAIDPGMAATIIMESAVPMSKMDPRDIFENRSAT